MSLYLPHAPSQSHTLIEIQAFWQYIAATVSGNIAAILLQRCCNTGFRMQISFWQYCSNSFWQYCRNIAAMLQYMPETVCTLMHMYALMESSFSLKYIFYYFRTGYTHSTTMTTLELVS